MRTAAQKLRWYATSEAALREMMAANG